MDDLAKGMGSDGSELCSVRLIILTHIMKSPDHQWYMAGTVSSVLKCRRASTL